MIAKRWWQGITNCALTVLDILKAVGYQKSQQWDKFIARMTLVYYNVLFQQVILVILILSHFYIATYGNTIIKLPLQSTYRNRVWLARAEPAIFRRIRDWNRRTKGEKRALSLTIGLVPSRGTRAFIGRKCYSGYQPSIHFTKPSSPRLHSSQPDVLQTRNNERNSCSLR